MRINGQRSTDARQLIDGTWLPTVDGHDPPPSVPSFETRADALELAQALPTLNPTATEQQHASAAARMLADMEGGAA